MDEWVWLDYYRAGNTILGIAVLITFIVWCKMLWNSQGRLRNAWSEYRRGKFVGHSYEESVIADLISDALDKAYLEDRITARMRNKWCKKIGTKYGLRDLLPRRKKLSFKAIKHLSYQIKKRLHPTNPEGMSPEVVKQMLPQPKRAWRSIKELRTKRAL